MRQDVLLPTLTVRETLQYVAELRLPPTTNTEERKRIVKNVILELVLKECAGTRIVKQRSQRVLGGRKEEDLFGCPNVVESPGSFL